MTAIAAIIEDNTVYIGGDSAGVDFTSFHISTRKDPKVFINGPFIMGFTSSYRMGQLLHYSFVPPKHPKRMSINRYMNTLFVDAVRKCFKDGGYMTVSEEEESGGTFIIGYRGRLFFMHGDLQIGMPANNYCAVGCGDNICLGSLHTTSKFDMEPKQRIRMALKAAEEYSSGVRGPFLIKQLFVKG